MDREPVLGSYLGRMLPLFAAVFLMRFAFSFTVVSLQYIVPNAASLGIISSAYPIMEMASGFFVGVLADKFGRRWIISASLIVSSIVSLAFTLDSNTEYLIIIHGIQGLCAAAIVVSSLALLTDLARNSSRGREMGTYDFSTIAGYGLGFFAALVIINGNPANAHLPFYVGSAAALFGGVLSALTLKDGAMSPQSRTAIRDHVRAMAKSNSMQTLLPTWFVLMMIVGVFLTFTNRISTLLVPTSHGLGQGFSSLRLDVIGAVVVVGGLILLGFSQTTLGALSDRFGRSRVSLIGQISVMGFLGVLIALVSLRIKLIYLLPFVGIFGAGLLAFTPAALAELADASPNDGRGSSMGFYSIAVGAGTIFGPLVGGELMAKYGTASGLSVLFGIGFLIVLIFMIPRVLMFSRNMGKDIFH